MARTKSTFTCMECGHCSPKWVGQCSGCGGWNTLVEEFDPSSLGGPARSTRSVTQPITEITGVEGRPVPTGIAEVDRVLGGGLVPGSVTLLGGEPGIGKSTLVLQLLASRARGGASCLYVAGEESPNQVRQRATRLGSLEQNISLVAETSLQEVLRHMVDLRPEICVIDSVQTLHSDQVPSAPGSVAQVRDCTHRLVQEAKLTGATIILVGHVTKEGQLAGPRILEHVVDTVLNFEGDRHNALRMLRAHKHRFGSTEELGIFTMEADGLSAVPDPSGLFIGDRRPGVAGSVVAPTLKGHRPLLVEVQTLVSKSQLPQARRSAQGLDAGRMSLLLAVLGSRVGVQLGGHDVYANAVGGAKVNDPGVDLAVCLSLVSTATGIPVGHSVVACGEVGLGGEIRQVGRISLRLTEAARLGFQTALVPSSAPEVDLPIRLVRCTTVTEAIRYLGLDG